ncbi:MAG: SHOCT domain-containing protein [Pseudomonadota bacterium]
MSKAREIAEERLAKGEITKAEFDEILSALSPDAAVEEAAPKLTSPPSLQSGAHLAPEVDVKPIDDLRTGLHYVGGIFAMIVTGLIATVIFRFAIQNNGMTESTSLLAMWGENSGAGIGAVLLAGFSIWIASFVAVGLLSIVVKAQVISAVNKTARPQDTLAELARQDAKRDDHFREQHIIHAMPGEAGDVSENQYQTKIRNGGAFLGAILIFAGLSWLMGSF